MSADDTRTEIAGVIESHLSTGIGCHCEKWKIDTSIRPVDPRKQHRGHVAKVLAEYVATKQAEAAGEALRLARRRAVRCYPKGLVPTHQVIADLAEDIDRIANPEAGA